MRLQEESEVVVGRYNISDHVFSNDDQQEVADDQLNLSGDSAISTNSAVSSGIEHQSDAV
jgi:hypothetical protein